MAIKSNSKYTDALIQILSIPDNEYLTARVYKTTNDLLLEGGLTEGSLAFWQKAEGKTQIAAKILLQLLSLRMQKNEKVLVEPIIKDGVFDIRITKK
jgi:hypothetical protein